jgi:membrane-bound lytic murein transglycosylase B
MKIKYLLKLTLLSILISTFVLPNLKGLAQVNLDEICQSMEKIEQACQTLSDIECRQLLEECANYYEEKSAQIEKDVTKTEQEKKTLQNQIYVLKKKIKNLDYQIYQSNLAIKDLGFQIEDTESSIEKISLKIKDSRYQLANILQCIYEEDQKSLIEILLSEKELSDFFENLTALEILNSKNKELLDNIKSLKSSLESEKELLSEEKEDTQRLLKIQTLQKKEQQETKEEQEYFLELTEAEYQKYLREKEENEKRAAEIRARIFELIGVPEAPTFGEAYEIAKYVERITGVRPALLLAVVTQESNIGKNVGQCYLKNPSTGEGVIAFNGKEVSRVMKPSRDVEPFLEITKELGRDPYNTLVSCPMSYGWGGAMGPAQFIPSTWVLYRDKVKAITGKAADPWDIKDAFLAAALYLADYGAAQQTYNAEWKAAMIYFSGTTNTKYRFYGDSVMKIASQYEEDIKTIESGS